MNKIEEGFHQWAMGAKEKELNVYGAFKAGYLRSLNDGADMAETISTSDEVKPVEAGALMEVAVCMRLAAEELR